MCEILKTKMIYGIYTNKGSCLQTSKNINKYQS